MTSTGKKLVSLVVSNNDFTTGQQSDDSTEKELESFFGDVSDTDDPTYHPQDYSPHMGHVDSADLVTLDDLLGRRDNETREQFGVEELQNIIEAVQEGEKQNSEATAVVEDFLTDLLKKTWLLIKPTKRWRKSDPSCWARNVAKKRRADGLSYRTKSKADTEKKKELEEVYLAHQERKKTCNKEKDKIKANSEENFSTVTFDLQAVLQIPTCDVGLLYYSRKLCVYNLTVYEAGLPNNAYCFPWSEVNGKKGSCEIGTILLHYLTNCVPENVTEISLFSDTCGGQNRNQFVAALLLWAVQKIDHFKVIEQKFLESGHSQMEADSMHSSIESAKKNTSVFSMMEWISIFKRARRRQTVKVDGKKIIREPYHGKEFKYNEFLDLKHLADAIMKNKTKDEKGNRVQWLKIKRIRYVKGEERKLFFNYDMSEHFNVMNIGETPSTFTTQHEYSTRKKMRHTENNSPADHELPNQLNRLYQEPLKITKAKKRDLINLCKKGIISEELHGWIENLKTEKLNDRLPEPTVSDSENEDDC
ncbi:unnamed protein product [Diatraea saccharalis]|uniref:DUF7869 domain-containing protein n=1 Tax=Diatraea saccharalis TaxID=40085 RepID=A0A9N9QT30_9NEOP|nr:unnamed protein product [Diatraea saccharalis]